MKTKNYSREKEPYSLNLSKSKFVTGVQCLKCLYLTCYSPELAGEVDETAEAIFEQGKEVGRWAQRWFSDGVWVEEDYKDHEAAVRRTQELMSNKNFPAIFEAAFTFDDICIRVDILERQSRNRWRMIEVKSTSEVKEVHLPDVAIQKYVLKNCGVKLTDACLMHLNKEYVFNGRKHDLNHLFTIQDLSAEIRGYEKDIPSLLDKQWRVLSGRKAPKVDPGKQCTKPYTCAFYDECNEELPADHVSIIPRLGEMKLSLLEEMKVESIHEIPDDFSLTVLQKRFCERFKTRKPYFGPDMSTHLSKLKYPLYFMDFETSNPALPRYRGMRPFSRIPFQWSVHVQQKAGGKLSHYEFLAEDSNDPREAFIQMLLKVLDKKGNIVVYNKSFEDSCLKEIGECFPKYREKIETVRQRIWDLRVLIQEHVYHPDFGGSFSLKAVLPALIPEMTYKGMYVAEGTQASLAYEEIVSGMLSKEEVNSLRKALLEYCKQDTFAMVRLLDRLRKVCKVMPKRMKIDD
jgi:predicted RecB family nuclease